MKKIRLREELSETEQDGTPIKHFSVDMWISIEGICEDSIKDMFEMYANGFAGLIGEISFEKGKEEEAEFMGEDMEMGWQR